MQRLPKKLAQKIEGRHKEASHRRLKSPLGLVDFSSNDYLGFAGSCQLSQRAAELSMQAESIMNGATGSRLLSGNHTLYQQAESIVANSFRADMALIYNSGYDANIGLLSAVPQRGDLVLYDELVHASIRDGLLMSSAKNIKFRHNDLGHLASLLEKFDEQEVYVVTESLFSMDGDMPDLSELTSLCNRFGARLVLDEAHAIGLTRAGLACELGLESQVFARIITFGKALGCHGAAVLGSEGLIDYLVNFSRSFIYTTALPPHSLACIIAATEMLNSDIGTSAIESLHHNIGSFRSVVSQASVDKQFSTGKTAIQVFNCLGNAQSLNLSKVLEDLGLDVRPIRYPTVPKGRERLRIVLHSFNTKEQIDLLVNSLINAGKNS
jgi:8-amino-7-oxononanoate synthase